MKAVGIHIKGQNHAHIVGDSIKVTRHYANVFHCKMYGTFNIRVRNHPTFLTNIKPSHVVVDPKLGENRYWLIKISKGKKSCFGWVRRWKDYDADTTLLEVISKELISEHFHTGELELEVHSPWDKLVVDSWAINQYWFQGFSFAPSRRADSAFLWDTINQIDWSGKSVLDIGCHYGYFSFEASTRGARVVGFDTNRDSIKMAGTIRDKIIQSDVDFVLSDPGGHFDVILYLSVHHQPDADYRMLAGKIAELKSRTDKLFIELIMPPMFPRDDSLSEEQIDKIVGGQILARYKHRVRGVRKVYLIEK